MSTLSNIRTKVRRLTGRSSIQQITNAQIDEYVNTFYLFDMPENLRLFSEASTFEFMTTANVDQYDLRTMQVYTYTDSSNVDQFEPAVDVYITLNPPVYVAGYQCFYTQDREQFFRIYPMLSQIVSTVEGDGTAGPYTTTFANVPVLQNSVTVGAIDSTDVAINCVDVPTNRSDGTWKQSNTNTTITGSVDYITGDLSVTFSNTIPSGNTVTFTAVPYQPNRSQALMFYNNIITLRPVPDQSYKVQINAFKRPTQMIDDADYPELKQWWQYLAYGAAKKIMEDAQDDTGLNSLMPGYKEQERLVLRRTIVQRTNQRTATIYTDMTGFPYGNFQNRI